LFLLTCGLLDLVSELDFVFNFIHVFTFTIAAMDTHSFCRQLDLVFGWILSSISLLLSLMVSYFLVLTAGFGHMVDDVVNLTVAPWMMSYFFVPASGFGLSG